MILKVSEKAGEGERIDKFLVSSLSGFSRSKIQKMLKSGDVLVNGEKVKVSRVLALGDKVFVNDEGEPKSLVDIPHSIVSKCAGLFFQSFRLYVVYEGEDKSDVISQLRKKVKDWDKA